MLAAPVKCYMRQCMYYVGIIQPDGTEDSEVPFCGAFPDGIPDEIAFGNDLHMKPWSSQVKPYVYEKSKDWENRWDFIPEGDLKLFRHIKEQSMDKG